MNEKVNIIFGSNVKGTGALIWSTIIVKKILSQNNSKRFFLFASKALKKKLKPFKNKNFVFIGYSELFFFFVKNFLSYSSKIRLISLGDYPLPLLKDQVAFVNQANLIKNKEYKFTSTKLIFLLKRIYFQIFSKNVKKFIVQSIFMKLKISKSYNLDKRKFKIFRNYTRNPGFKFNLYKNRKIIKLIYPSNHYDHKNHELLIELFKNFSIQNLEIHITATKNEFQKFKFYKNFKRLNYFKNNNVFKIYSKFDAIIFPSLNESLGLPILEAKLFKMPIICSNLQYSRELLGKKAFFFNPLSPTSLYKSLNLYFELKSKKNLKKKIFSRGLKKSKLNLI